MLVGSEGAYFTLRNLVIHHTRFQFRVPDLGAPLVVDHAPKANTIGQTPTTDISLTFNKMMRPGGGSLVLYSSEGTYTFEAHDPKLHYEGPVVRLAPEGTLPDTVSYEITMEAATVRSVGAWQLILEDYLPRQTTPMDAGCTTVDSTYAELQCYITCRDTPGCGIFKVATSGPQAGQCCLLAGYYLGIVSIPSHFTHSVDPALNLSSMALTSSGVILSPGHRLCELQNNTSAQGISFGGIAGPDGEVKGSLNFAGMSSDDFRDPKVQSACKTAIAKVAMPSDIADITPEQITLRIDEQTSRRQLSVIVHYTVTLPASMGLMPSASALQVVASSLAEIGTSNSSFLTTFKIEAQALGAQSVVLNQFLTVAGTAPTISQAASAFGFHIADLTGPQIVDFSPSKDSSDVEPSSTIRLTFTEGVVPGTGHVVLLHRPGTIEQAERRIDVNSHQVHCEDHEVFIQPEMWLEAGHYTMSITAGAFTDDSHPATAQPAAFSGLLPGVYHFTVKSQLPKAATPGLITFGPSGRCSYVLEYFTCESTECMVLLKPRAKRCGPSEQSRKISFDAYRRISRANGGSPEGSLLSYGGGALWPEYGVAEFTS